MLSSFNNILQPQKWLIPELQLELETELTPKQQLFVKTIEMLEFEKYTYALHHGMGRPKESRTSLFKAFILKAVYNEPTTSITIEIIKDNPVLLSLCGWECKSQVPSESTFSRAFKEFSDMNLNQLIQDDMTTKYLSNELPHHASIDGTSIQGRETPCRKNTPTKDKKKKEKKKVGRPKKGEEVKKDPKRVELQGARSLEDNIEDLPQNADWGAKKDSKGNKMKWTGFKLHLSCIDGDIPVSAILTSASVHDSQVAIPLMQMTESRTNYLYDLMDAAYDSPAIREYSENAQRIPIIDPNKRKKNAPEMAPARKLRYNERSTAERVNSDLKDNHGGRNVRVRGDKKVFLHLMFELLVITVKKLHTIFSL